MVFFCILKQKPSNITIKENQNYIKFDEFYFVLPSLIRNLAALNILALDNKNKNCLFILYCSRLSVSLQNDLNNAKPLCKRQ